jgi:Domain of Unknown Function (DUF1080)
MTVTAEPDPNHNTDRIDEPQGSNAPTPATAEVSAPAERPDEADATPKTKGMMTKVIGGIGAAIMSMMIALGVKYGEGIINPKPPAPPPQPIAVVIHNPAETPKTHPGTTPTTHTNPPPANLPPDPTKLYETGTAEPLFNGTDLTGFYSMLGDPKELKEVAPANPLGKNNDPLKVFSVQDGLLRVSGEVYGALLTEKEYGDYVLTAEYKWGDKTWPPRTKLARNSGILLHCVGPDDGVRKTFPQAIRCRIEEGRTGDFRLWAAKPAVHSLSVECEERGVLTGAKTVAILEYKPGAPARTMLDGDLYHLGMTQGWRDVKGWYSPNDAEKQAGQWNTLECYCFGDSVTIRLNGKVVNHATRSAQTKGKIGLFSLKSEILFRTLEVRPLTKK